MAAMMRSLSSRLDATRMGRRRGQEAWAEKPWMRLSQEPGQTQFVRITKVFRLAAGQGHQACLGFRRDGRLPAGTWAIVERRDRTFDHGALDATLHRLMVQSQRPSDRVKRGVFPIAQKYSRPLTPPA